MSGSWSSSATGPARRFPTSQVTARFEHPFDAAKDRLASLASDGLDYEGVATPVAPGRWTLVIEANRGAERLLPQRKQTGGGGYGRQTRSRDDGSAGPLALRSPSRPTASRRWISSSTASHCGACIVTIEKGLRTQEGVRGARVNLASKRVTVEWNDGALEPPAILERLEALGYPAFPFAVGRRRQRRDARRRSGCCAASASPLSAR